MSRLIIFIVVVLPQPDGPTSTVSSPRGEGQVELGDADGAVGVALADPLQPDLLGGPPYSAPGSRRGVGLAVASTGWSSWEAPGGRAGGPPVDPSGARGVDAAPNPWFDLSYVVDNWLDHLRAISASTSG